MFGVDSGELFLIVLVAVVVIGPKDLPRVMRTIGQWVARARGMANQFRSGVDQMVRESEISDLEQKWREQNESIMTAHPPTPPTSTPTPPGSDTDWGLPSETADPALAPRTAPSPPVTLAKDNAPPRLDKDVGAATSVQPPSAPARRAPRTAPEAL